MLQSEIMDIFKETGVMLEGHFLLTSGKHSAQYMQCAKLFQYPNYSRALCDELAKRFGDIDVVIGPAMGGIIMAYEVASCLGARNVFTERQEGAMTLRRGFEVNPGERVLICEDVVTTGGSVVEVSNLVREAGAELVGVCAIVDRSAGKVDFGCKFESAVKLEIETYEASECPLCKTSAAVKPGSRK